MTHTIERVTTTEQRKVAAKFVNDNHSYINWADRPSRKIYWLCYEDGQLVGVFGLGSAFAKPKAVAEWMKERGITFNEVGNNIVYCLAGHTDRNAGTKLLALLRRDSVVWWQERYGDALRAWQTFILPPRTGAVYKADNWTEIGITSGKTQSMRTLYGEERESHPEAERRVFASGEIRYLLREFRETEKKLIYMKAA